MKNIILSIIIVLMIGSPVALYADNTVCKSGKNQSPINIDVQTALTFQKRGLKFNYGRLDPKKITNTGTKLTIDVTEGASIKVDGIEFGLKHLSFHIPSEHTYNNHHFPMEIQFVHQSNDNQWAMVSVMVSTGKSSRTLAKLQQQLPMNAGESKSLAANALRNLERKQRVANYYRYSGSLTSPPCTEGVRWFIMNNPLTLSKPHFQQFRQAIKQDNNRPVQALNARIVLK
jgi:carbonic anhydrase